jgi:hypothetical protein
MHFLKKTSLRFRRWVYSVSGSQRKIDNLAIRNKELESRALELSRLLTLKEKETNEALELAAQTERTYSKELELAESRYSLNLRKQIEAITRAYNSDISIRDTQIRELMESQTNTCRPTPDLQRLLQDFATIPVSTIQPNRKDKSDTDHHAHKCKPYSSFLNRLAQLPFIEEMKCTGVWKHVKNQSVKHIGEGDVSIIFPFDGEGYETNVRTTGKTIAHQAIIAAYLLSLYNKTR